ncbi:DUF134 domain-containing protein [Acidaminobacter sp. JC074]|uniref:DUF134 domain-containing protein n=1 Tax=Acidaminobacter sp. JC074 TaxID=2530199 RepID=UPI001F0EC861|nr:DUF134 domain-containing protein [Acidaminobacter sp. JC074]MCH4887313.1 DUF134 domain-containing protein [Acidaminobacter sp. JC074]
MPRPTKWRKISFVPEHTLFKPCGIPKSKLETIILKVEELEAIRLKDTEGLNQMECAEKMSVSRQTFQNILESARRKVAEALTTGKGIHITGGKYTYNICDYVCQTCDHEFSLNVEGQAVCPVCGSKEVVCANKEEFCRMNCPKNE